MAILWRYHASRKPVPVVEVEEEKLPLTQADLEAPELQARKTRTKKAAPEVEV